MKKGSYSVIIGIREKHVNSKNYKENTGGNHGRCKSLGRAGCYSNV